MRRLAVALWYETRLQYRNGFLAATVVIIAAWLLLLRWASQFVEPERIAWLLPLFVLDSMVVNSFFFVGGLLLLEKGEGSLYALAVTPLRSDEYLVTKVATLGGLALFQNLVVVGLLARQAGNLVLLCIGILVASTLYVLFGVVTVARYDSINDYLLPAIIPAAFLLAPMFPHVFGWNHWLLYLHPMQGPLMLIRAAFEPLPGGTALLAFLASVVWIGLAFQLARRVFVRSVVAKIGS
jgi:fluoroquinolone transport system permease protein